MRAWFGFTIVLFLGTVSVTSFFIDQCRKLGVPRATTGCLVAVICNYLFRAIAFFNPQINVKIVKSDVDWASIPGKSCVAINHTSFWDAIVFSGFAPLRYVYNCRTLVKASLRKLPVFGPVFDRCGHFPVYFKGEGEGDFSVDQAKQAEVTERLNEHLKNGGRIAFFPEGIVNKDVATLKPFRRGSFKTITENQLQLYYMVIVGNNECWPATAAIGGYPAEIRMVLRKFNYDSSTNPSDLADALQAAMQQELLKLIEQRSIELRSTLH